VWRKPRWVAFWLAAFSALTFGCDSTPQIRTSYDHAVTFERYRTFAMAHPDRPVPTSGGVDPFRVFRLRQMVYSQLKSQGYTPVAFETAELQVTVNADALTRTEVIPAANHWTPYPDPYVSGADVRTIKTMLLKVDLVDAARGALVWHGAAEISESQASEDAGLWEVVQAVVSAFPPRATP
jgi:hypothetical protein